MLKQCVTKQCGSLRLLTWVAGRDVSSIIRKKNFKEVEQYLNQKVIENFEEVTLADILEIYQQSNGKSVSSAQYKNTSTSSLQILIHGLQNTAINSFLI